MLTLTTESVQEYWQQISPDLGKLFVTIEKTEDWTLDNNPDIAERLVSFGLRLSDPVAIQKFAAADKNDLLFFLVYISSSKAFRLIQWLDESENGLGSRLLNELLEQNGTGIFANVMDPMLAGTLIQRLRIVQNTPFFQALLSPSLLDSIVRSINNYRDEKDTHET